MKSALGINPALSLGLLLSVGFAFAAPITYEGQIGTNGSPYGSVSGSVGGGSWGSNDPAGTDFWFFNVGPGGISVDIWAIRTDSDLDPAFTLYSGITNTDEVIYASVNWGESFGRITVLAIGDDEISNPGPWGDPALYSIALAEGNYTISIGGVVSNGIGPYSYNLFIGAPGDAPISNPVPLPTAFWLFGSGLISLIGLNRKCK